MHTISGILKILEPILVEQSIKNDFEINDFEINIKNLEHSNAALINISEASWRKWFRNKKSLKSNFSHIESLEIEIPLIISDERLPESWFGNYIIVENAFEAMKLLGTYFREKYQNPLIAITGSFGKSSTRMMLETVLGDYELLYNRGNANMRIPIMLNLCKLIRNPDFALFEVSLNALNNRGNMATNIKPDIAIVTGIGEAHLSSFSGTEEIAEFKARLFKGLSEEGVAIINGDTLHVDVLERRARLNTTHIKKYQIENDNEQSNIRVTDVKTLKGAHEIAVVFNGNNIKFMLNSLSKGMVYNSLAVLLALSELNVDLEACVAKFSEFKPLKKVLEFKEVTYKNAIYTLIDDTHNASLPAMINAIETFNNQAHFFKGRKVIAIGKINDLGEDSEMLHRRLIPILNACNADYILCLDSDLKMVVNRVKNKKITWYKDYNLLARDLCTLLTPDSITLLKSSVTGTLFPRVAEQLPKFIEAGLTQNKALFHTKKFIPALTLIPENIEIDQVDFSDQTLIEGIAPLFYYIYAKSLKVSNRSIQLKKWRTNDNNFYTGKTIMMHDLIELMINQPHPSAVYQLSNELFNSEKDRQMQADKFIKKYNLSLSAIINVTGRYMLKERHEVTHRDLYRLYRQFEDILMSNREMLCFGYDSVHGFFKTDMGIVIFTSYPSIEQVRSDVSQLEKSSSSW
ncbi:UDP-N-acetylmuramoyl-tripeptide--D-alanyl-D-alanine ligase [Staphylococcus pseudintermedius]|nr:UDP-N-acetylmuramoyl-tripeptide--D-alanyl-D-alanine ligase [Staphylococcus pseudintermedius]USH39030.1 UDP-N-acetylmuramoyl-tripeptide--D-alanyl-D-alanine ligase [Staphylococcus pseudintermedius]USH41804.1 UDP-N-acetylmuramoyl-tripeptide--D-alanyl-D-alanine ligase [Staphylococcus pseudintermedius]USJ90063.1 UDP-N-acetylmuramoyl-tripeptide--D-alanyl-D-alanine ligase [Staphylococcus pseudintermedius]USJ92734.1 UDP-N-acetylmuramoyl-tripeptide--D-alanyl-D-alanine ligase [Staphylococcus pseudinte